MATLKTNFVLKWIKGKQRPILLVLNFGYKEFDKIKGTTTYKGLKYYTGVTATDEEWDVEKKLPKSRKKVQKLLHVEQLAQDIYSYLELENAKITPDLLKQELDIRLGRAEKSADTVAIVDYIREVMMNEARTAGTVKQYNSLANRIADFENITGKKLYAHTLDEQLYNEFMDYVRGRVNRINSVWSSYKGLRAVLKDIARRYEIEVFSPSEKLSAQDKVQKVSEDKIYLNFEQLEKIMDHEPESESLRNVQFILMILAFTGCRYSDVFKVVPEFEYKRNGTTFRYAHFLTTKNDTEIKVPILKPLAQFFERNNWNPPHKISEQKFNKYVKELVKQSGLKEEVTMSFTNSFGEKEFETRNLYEFVTSHIGRRSFITNLINFVPITILAKITGHTIKDRSIIFGYNKITLIENAALFVKELKRIQDSHKEEFLFELV